MDLSKITPPRGAVRNKKRRGRGQRSGHGKTSCRGHKGANARSGSTTHIGFEGGQMPLIRRLPKRGFNRDEHLEYQIVNIDNLGKASKDGVVDANGLLKKGMIKKLGLPVKILGAGEIDKPLTVKADAFSESAKTKIEKAGGKAEIVKCIR